MAIRHTHAAVNLRAISRAFGAAPAVSRITFRVEGGETVFVRGPNGAGKSTLLRIIATAISPTAGMGEVLGFDLLAEREEIRRRTELVSHGTRLYEDLTALENLRFAAVMHGVNPGPGAEGGAERSLHGGGCSGPADGGGGSLPGAGRITLSSSRE